MVQPKAGIVPVALPAATKEVPAVNVSSAPPAPTVFKTIGYVEKAGGQLEAVILQDNQVQVVHIGDLIAGRLRVTKVSPDSVDAVDETQVPAPMAKPNATKSDEITASNEPQAPVTPAATGRTQDEIPAVAAESGQPGTIASAKPVSAAPVAQGHPSASIRPVREARIDRPCDVEPVANSLGYVEKADGKVEAVVADGDSVSLVPETLAAAMAQVAPSPPHQEEATLAQVSSAPAATPLDGERETLDSSADSEASPSGVGKATLASSADSEWTSAAPLADMIRQASYAMVAQDHLSATISPTSEDRIVPPREVDPTADSLGQVLPAPSGIPEGSLSILPGAGSVGEATGTTSDAEGPAAHRVVEKASGSTASSAKMSVTMKPLGFVVKADGELEAIVSEDDEVYIVRQGDRFAGHYRALRVSQDEVEAVEDPPKPAQSSPSFAPKTFPGLLSTSAQPGPYQSPREDCLGCNSDDLGEVSARVPEDPMVEVAYPPSRARNEVQARSAPAGDPQLRSTANVKESGTSLDPATFVFQTLGYVESQDGEMEAIVVDGSQAYVVKQGETFADQYVATSVDSVLVLAVRVSPDQYDGNSLSARTEPGGNHASKKLYGYPQFPWLGLANVQAPNTIDAAGWPALTDLESDSLDSSLTGFAVTFFQGR